MWGKVLVKTKGYVLCEGEEGGGGGVVGSEAMLGRGDWEEGKFWEKKSLQDLDGGAEEGDGTVTGAGVWLFARLQHRDNGSMLPYGREV